MAYKIVAPTGQKIIALPIESKEEKVDSLWIPETANANLSIAKIIAVGEAVAHLYKAGDEVIYPSGAGQGYFYQGKPHIWLDGGDEKNISNIWGIVTKDN